MFSKNCSTHQITEKVYINDLLLVVDKRFFLLWHVSGNDICLYLCGTFQANLRLDCEEISSYNLSNNNMNSFVMKCQENVTNSCLCLYETR